ncbi:hypothetical protein ATCM_03440 [Stenotrophomonas sp. ATCM1_4]|uniref:LysR substrate-binding domain-containing protein n=1 Tax=Stenotrophomonas sp. ATCM1_4 TaxID=2259330 RepID=UPI00104B8B0C|nr:LysR substrate-binding domain-containing protein [Stenotrophomonas sp. ATCM1_4]TDB26781.1 hypothetical protein ATCM_03440 [Stenotrophomonas sp. ATCM1_4]
MREPDRHVARFHPHRTSDRPIDGSLVASPQYLREHGTPTTPEQLAAHQLLTQGVETWRFMSDQRVISVPAQGRFRADNGAARAAAAMAGLGIACLPRFLVGQALVTGALVAAMPHYPVPAVASTCCAHPARKIRALAELLIRHLGTDDSPVLPVT